MTHQRSYNDSISARASIANRALTLGLALGCFLMLVFSQNALAKGFEFVTTTGRAVIMHKDAEQEARMIALEDALYSAALQGGAQINGFSLITTDTAIDDHFVVRPASRILDYTIVNEVIEEEHYAVTIEAAVGDLPDTKCQARNHSNVTVFAPEIRVASTAPAWTRQFADIVVQDISMQLSQRPSLNTTIATNTRLNAATLARSNDTFDYIALTTGRIRVGAGDYAIIPEIQLTGETSNGPFLSTYVMRMEVTLKLLSGAGYEPLFEHSVSKVINVDQQSLIRNLDVVNRPKRPAILAEMLAPIGGFIDDFATKLKCRPLKNTLDYAGGNLTVALGTHHGVGVNSLAIASGTDTPWQILRVIDAGPLTATLMPLNKQRDAAGLAGQTIEFMELR